jgi:hypothetical protein
MDVKLSREQMLLQVKVYLFFSMRPEFNLLTEHEKKVLHSEINRFKVLAEENKTEGK